MVEFIMYHYVRDVKNSLFPKLKALDHNDFKFQINLNMADTNRISESKKTSPLRMKPPLRSERKRAFN